MKILKSSEMNAKMTALIAGMPESGKTKLASTLLSDPDMLPALVIVLDGSEIVLRDFADNPKFDIVVPETYEDIEEIIKLVDSPSCKYKSIFVDNITHLHRKVLESAANERGVKVGSNNRNKFKYEQSDYGIARNSILYFADSILKHYKRYNIYFTCWATDYKDEDNKLGNLQMDMAGKLVTEMAGLFNLVGAMFVDFEGVKKIPVYNLYTQKTMKIQWARNKLNLLPPIINNPSLPDIKRVMLSKNIE